MENVLPVQYYEKKIAIKTMIISWLLVATLDICSAFLYFIILNHKSPVIILPAIASGVFGKAAFAGGGIMFVWGFLFHYLIAFVFTVFFFMIYKRSRLLARNIFVTAILYGLFVWMVMNLVVIPMSNLNAPPFNLTHTIINAANLIFCIGLPLTFIARGHYHRRS